jgi:dsRNA-specific ribonuclease
MAQRMAPTDLHRLPLLPAPDLRRLFGPRDGAPREDPDAARLRAAESALGVRTRDPRLLRCALTDPGWCNEAETPPWVDPWPGNRALAESGAPALESRGIDPAAAARRADALGLWPHLWLTAGQRQLRGAGRDKVLARGLAALMGALIEDHDGDEARAAAALGTLLAP